MKRCVLWVLLLVSAGGMALMLLSFSKTEKTSLFPVADFVSVNPNDSAHCKNDATIITSSRKLKEITQPSTNMKRGGKSVNLDDYLPTDPAPSSKASVQPGPIQHRNPLIPFIPKTPPSGPSKDDSFP